MSKRKLTRRQAWRIQKIQDERRRRAEKQQATDVDLPEDATLGEEQTGVVISHFGTQVEVEAVTLENNRIVGRQGKAHRCHLRANLGGVVTGDRVSWRAGQPIGVIEAVLPRDSQLSRPDPYGDMKTIAANIDHIYIVIAAYPEPVSHWLDRYLVAAETLGIACTIVLNKTDRITVDNRPVLSAMCEQYRSLGYPWLSISAKTSTGMAELEKQLEGSTNIFVGQSGVGKSSLIAKLLPDEELRIGEVSEATQKGTHTTTAARLYHFAGGGSLIDSPGIREFGLWHMNKDQVLEGFREFRNHLGLCKFRDCAHESDPGCAIQQALTDGKISRNRYESYCRILDSIVEK